jgi:hypothetical protein
MKALTLLKGIGIGAGLMYLFDPEQGRRRRALARDQVVHTMHAMNDIVDEGVRDFTNRVNGTVAEMRRVLKKECVPDDVLVARVRSEMGHVVSNAKAIEVEASHGIVTLRGSVPSSEVDSLLTRVDLVPGVLRVLNYLEVRPRSEEVPGSPQASRRYEIPFDWMPVNWTPTTRLCACLTGGWLAFSGLQRKGVVGLASSVLGLGLLGNGVAQARNRRMVNASSLKASYRNDSVPAAPLGIPDTTAREHTPREVSRP